MVLVRGKIVAARANPNPRRVRVGAEGSLSSPFERTSLPPGALAVVPLEDVDVDADAVAHVVGGVEPPTPPPIRRIRPSSNRLQAPATQPQSLFDCSALATVQPQTPSGLQTCRDLRPVGACLTQFLHAWEEITQDHWVLNVISNGYAPSFPEDRPPLTRLWRKFESITGRTPPKQAVLLQEHIQELLAKKAIEPVKDQQSLGFYSHMFLVPKKNGKLRPIINLKQLNSFLDVPTFQMETARSVASAVQPGDWATSLDLTDAYFHVPIAPWFRKYLRIVVNGQIYQYRALPFGLSTSPRVFTKMLEPVAVFLHSRGIHIHRYLDDLLIRSQSRDQCLEWTLFTLALLFRLGLGVNLEKSDLTPAQVFKYIGILFLTALGLMTPPEDRLLNIQTLGELLLSKECPASQWLSFIGLLGSAEKQVPFGRLNIRPIHFCLRHQFLIGVHPLEKLVKVNQEARQAILWWLDRSNTQKGQPLGQFQPDLTLNTDASMTGWGAHAPGFQASGDWSPEQLHLSINALELMAVTRTTPRLWLISIIREEPGP